VKISNKVVYSNLDKLFEKSEEIQITDDSKWVIFSDLHMGDGGSTDDFKRNSDLFTSALQKYYLKKGYSLFLNGDVEELQRFKMNKIYKHWKGVYDLFQKFSDKNNLLKTIGNHDLQLGITDNYPCDFHTTEGFRFNYEDNDIFLFHGHQASKKYQKHNELIGFTLKYFANPLGIKSYSVSHDSRKQYNIEKRVYHYSSFNKRVSIIGHTHRPLFESLHKVERLKFLIEQLCRDYSAGLKAGDPELKQSIKAYKKELKGYYKKNINHNYMNYVYNTIFHIPCLFNSGTVIGKRGMTCIEIEKGRISLIHWFDKNISKKYLLQTGYKPEQLDGTDYYRMVINRETLNYIFTRIKFLS
jgi:predicted phosphodiesterase